MNSKVSPKLYDQKLFTYHLVQNMSLMKIS